jgi:hypothetical protein
MTNLLSLGCDCKGSLVLIYYMDAENSSTEPVAIRNAICIHEEDAGTSSILLTKMCFSLGFRARVQNTGAVRRRERQSG